MKRVLYIFLPCKQIYPVGATYLANYVHRHEPDVRQRILDLSLYEPERRSAAVREAATDLRPDVVAFSWRDIQIYSPHEGDDAMEQAFAFYHSRDPIRRLRASVGGLRSMVRYYRSIRRNLGYVHLIRQLLPRSSIMIGGGAFGVFAEQLIERLPEGTIGILGEGESAVLKVIRGESLADERFIVREGSRTVKGTGASYTPLEDMTIDLQYVSDVFPQHRTYTHDCVGVQTKRGCPFSCAFCLYPYLEGQAVRYRPPAHVVQDISEHYRHWGTRRFWFTDAQFITGKVAYPHCTEILERILAAGMNLEWSGYVRTSLINADLAGLMVRSGVGDLEVAITSGSQDVLNKLHMGFKLEGLYAGCHYLKEAGFAGKLILNYSLNAPGETEETLRDSVDSYKRIAAILGEDRVFPMMFFLGIQPHTDLENQLLETGYLSAGYNPLNLTPSSTRKLLYNPAPLSNLIGRACLAAWDRAGGRRAGTRDRTPWAGPSELPPGDHYADTGVLRGVQLNSGRDVLLTLEQLLAARSQSGETSQAPS